MRKINWNNLGFWILAALILLFIIYLILSGRAWK